MARIKLAQANILALKKLEDNTVLDLRPLIVYIMRNSGCTYSEIGEVFDVSKQMAVHLYKNAEKEIV